MPLFHTSTVGQIDDSSAITGITMVGSEINSVLLLGANPTRKGVTVFNQSEAKLYLALSSTASMGVCTAQLDAYDYYEVPFNYTGPVSGVWSAVSGSALITEFI